MVTIEANPKPVEIDPARTALVVVDMQNIFAGRGDGPGLPGGDTSGALGAIEKTRRLADAARASAVRVVYLAMIKNPERGAKPIIRTSRDIKIVDELLPRPGDKVIEKCWYSGFRGTDLDKFLKRHRLEYLLFTGIATNICVESTLRDAYFLNYWPILVSDATHNAGPPATQQATLWNVEEAFGWVATTDAILKALSGDGVKAVSRHQKI